MRNVRWGNNNLVGEFNECDVFVQLCFAIWKLVSVAELSPSHLLLSSMESI